MDQLIEIYRRYEKDNPTHEFIIKPVGNSMIFAIQLEGKTFDSKTAYPQNNCWHIIFLLNDLIERIDGEDVLLLNENILEYFDKRLDAYFNQPLTKSCV